MSLVSQYRDLLIKLLPRGKAWKVEPQSDTFKFLEAIATEFARLDQRVRDLIRESDPRYATELLPEWEKEFGIPDACTVVAGSVQQRRFDLVTRITAVGGSSIEYFQSIFDAQSAGITISQKDPAVVGMPVGGALDGPAMLSTFFVNIPIFEVNYFEAGDSAGEALVDIYDPSNVICFIEKNKPADSYVVYTFNS